MNYRLFAGETDDDVDAADPGSERRAGHFGDNDFARWNVFQSTRVFEKEVVVFVSVGIEVRSSGIDHDLTQQTRFGELVERVVDRREGNLDVAADGFFMKPFRGDVPMTILEEQPRECQALARRAQIRAAKALKDLAVRSITAHDGQCRLARRVKQ